MGAGGRSGPVEIFVTQPIPERALARLRAAGNVRVHPESAAILPLARLKEEVRRCDVLYCMLHDRISEEVIASAERLRLIAASSSRPGNVAVAAAAVRGIAVTTIPRQAIEATADLQWGLLIAVARRIVEADRAVRRGLFPGAQSMHFVGGEVHGKTLGTIGLGEIGSAVARRARGFGMPVVYTKRNPLDPEQDREFGIEYRSLEELLRASDFVVVNASYHRGTHHLIGPAELALMKPTAYLINTARGPIVDEEALVEALRAGRIAGAALDVYEHEPQIHPALAEMERVVITPHIGSAARETRQRIAESVADNILAFLRGERPPNLWSPASP